MRKARNTDGGWLTGIGISAPIDHMRIDLPNNRLGDTAESKAIGDCT